MFAVLAAFILLAPAANQVFGYQSQWLRPWIMFSDVGVGVLKGSFTVEAPGGSARELEPLEVLDLPFYPMIRHYVFPNRVLETEDIVGFAAQFCRALSENERLSYRGLVGTRHGWKPIEMDDICGRMGTRAGPDGHPEAPGDA